MKLLLQASALLVCACSIPLPLNAQIGHTGSNPLEMPESGSHTLRILSPSLIELVRINRKSPNPARVDAWDFFTTGNVYQAPNVSEFAVTVNGTPAAIQSIGFKRRPLYAPLDVWDVRLTNALYLTLASPIPEGQTVVVTNPSGALWPSAMTFTATMDPLRYSPAIHVNQEGYVPGFPKEAMVGYFLGNMGEMTISASLGFSLVHATTGAEVFTGTLTPRLDTGFTYTPTPYQKVLEADFTSFTTPGKYKLKVPGLGASLPFVIDEGIALCHARTYAQGLYHQRCGMAKAHPYSRFTHGACHTAVAEIPLPESAFSYTWTTVAAANADYANNPRHTAPRLSNAAAQLYPIQRTGTLDVSRGHHDAGDYSKYTCSSAALIHYLTFAADVFPNVGDLDNLGLPESSDGKSDLLQEAKWEADFLAKLQDTDGGFFFLVYPKTRKYENDVLPDQGDSQVVWPKNTSATASAVAALAQLGSSPRFQQQYPVEAALYLAKATAGWNFLMNAIATHGKDGSYQKITHYGDVFMHDDELVWAAAAMFAATGDPVYQAKMMEWMPDPNSSNTRRWGWWRCFEGYGWAMRTYAFAARTGRVTPAQMNAAYLQKCENELIAAGNDQTARAAASAYGSSLPSQEKSWDQTGWNFSNDKGFDIAVAHQLSAQPGYLPAIVSNMNYEAGSNPLNMMFLTGLGWKRQHEIVSQYAHNDRRILPPSGLCLGNMQSGFAWIATYGSELGQLNYPSDSASTNRYPLYDRWADTYNTSTEFVLADLSMGLSSLSFLSGQTSTRTQTWKSATGTLTLPANPVSCGSPATVTLNVPGMDLSAARVVWEARDQKPSIGGGTVEFSPAFPGAQWVEAEATWPDGRRVVASGTFNATNNAPGPGSEYTPNSETLALYHFTGNFSDSGPGGYHLTPGGNVTRTNDNLGWMINPSGEVARFSGFGDKLSVTLPDSAVMPGATTTPVTIEAWIYPQSYVAYGKENCPVLELSQASDARFGILDGKWNNPKNPHFSAANTTVLTAAQWKTFVQPYKWQHVQITFDSSATVRFYLDGVLLSSATVPQNYGRSSNWTLTLGNFKGDLDEVRVSKSVTPVLLPTVTVALTDSSATEAGGAADPGVFTFSRSGGTTDPLVVFFSIAGSATNGTDYPNTMGALAIPAGSRSETLSLPPTDDSFVEGNETVAITLSPNPNYTVGNPSAQTLNITDNDAAAIDEFVVDADTIALYHFNGDYNNSASGSYHLTAAGGTSRTSSNRGWMQTPAGEVVRFRAVGDTLSATIPDSALQPGPAATALTLEARIYPRAYKAYSVGNYPVIDLFQHSDSRLGAQDGKWSNPRVPTVYGASTTIMTNTQWASVVPTDEWSHLKVTFAPNGIVSCYINDVLISYSFVSLNTGRTTNWTLTLGNFDGDMDEVRISKVVR